MGGQDCEGLIYVSAPTASQRRRATYTTSSDLPVHSQIFPASRYKVGVPCRATYLCVLVADLGFFTVHMTVLGLRKAR